MYKDFDFSNMPVVDAVNEIIINSVERGASDIHFDPTDDFLKVRIRVDGVLDTFTVIPNNLKQNIITRIKLLSGMNITETRLPQDGAIKTVLKGHNLDLRVSSLPTKKGEKIVIRILDYSMSLKGIEYLYFSESNYKKVLKMISSPNGIILVTGATGSGKSTTVYSFLQRLNVEGVNLVTVEDPVEMDIKGINQVQVNSDIGLDFATVLRSILRQDPNIIMIGEIRDSETARIAVRASITGHLVLSTIHTNNSLNTIERLLDMDVERYLLASALEGIISQTLARKLCDKCKRVRPTTNYEKQLFKSILNLEVNQLYAPTGCQYCNKGYRGRIALQEVLVINQDIRDAISAGMRKDELRELVYTKDVITLLHDGLYKVLAGFTTLEEVLKLVDIDDSFEVSKNTHKIINNQNTTLINPNDFIDSNVNTNDQINTNTNININNDVNTANNNNNNNNNIQDINAGIAKIKESLANKTQQQNNSSNDTKVEEIKVDNKNNNNNLTPNLDKSNNSSTNLTPNINGQSNLGSGFNMQDNFVNMNMK